MGKVVPDHIMASHLNFFPSNPPYPWRNPIVFLQSLGLIFSARDKAGLQRIKEFMSQGQAYSLIHATKPQTIGYALQDSPAALLAWIYEKLHDWTDDYPWTDDEVCTWTSIYYFSTAGAAASARIYYEASPEHTSADNVSLMAAVYEYIPRVKLGLSYFPKEIYPMPHAWGRVLGPVVFENRHNNGGHFAAWEQPDALAGDVKAMFGKGGPAYGVVPGRAGYKGQKKASL